MGIVAADDGKSLGEYGKELRRRVAAERVVTVDVKVTRRSQLAEVYDVTSGGVLKVKVRAAPERGRANQKVSEVLAAFLGVPRSGIKLVAGSSSQRKRFRVESVQRIAVRIAGDGARATDHTPSKSTK
jgi:uncharacterized protein YggU (UPF0235/DUF167 family)